ncbi:MAG: hypothetical protein ACKO5K_08760 [Armatimonadota bacterium]
MTLWRDALHGALAFTAAAGVVFASVAYGELALVRALGPIGAYVLWTVSFLALGSWFLAPLAGDRVARRRFPMRFCGAFLAYAVLWCVAWVCFPSKLGEWLGAAVGAGTLGALIAPRGARPGRPAAACLVFAGNAVGYFIGDALHTALGRPLGMLLWGATFGIGTGAALGAVIGSGRSVGKEA